MTFVMRGCVFNSSRTYLLTLGDRNLLPLKICSWSRGIMFFSPTIERSSVGGWIDARVFCLVFLASVFVVQKSLQHVHFDNWPQLLTNSPSSLLSTKVRNVLLEKWSHCWIFWFILAISTDNSSQGCLLLQNFTIAFHDEFSSILSPPRIY